MKLSEEGQCGRGSSLQFHFPPSNKCGSSSHWELGTGKKQKNQLLLLWWCSYQEILGINVNDMKKNYNQEHLEIETIQVKKVAIPMECNLQIANMFLILIHDTSVERNNLFVKRCNFCGIKYKG